MNFCPVIEQQPSTGEVYWWFLAQVQRCDDCGFEQKSDFGIAHAWSAFEHTG